MFGVLLSFIYFFSFLAKVLCWYHRTQLSQRRGTNLVPFLSVHCSDNKKLAEGLSRALEVGAFGAVTPRSDLCLPRDWQVWPISGSALSFASRAVPTHLALQPVLFRGMISWTLHVRVHRLLHTSVPE